MKPGMIVLCLCVGTALLAGCVTAKPLSRSTAQGQCYAYTVETMSGDTRDDCRAQKQICDDVFMDADASMGRDACLDACKSTISALRRRHAADGCGYVVTRADDLCSRYCRSNTR